VPEPAAEPPPQIMEGIVIEPLRKYNGNGSDEPVRLEDFMSEVVSNKGGHPIIGSLEKFPR
jgi:hypothetical protein